MSKQNILPVIPAGLVLERLRWENPWWVSGKIEDSYAAFSPRPYLELFLPLVTSSGVKRATVMMGPRRVGKTVMMHHAIQRLLHQGVHRQRVAYVSIDNPLYLGLGLEQIFARIREAIASDEMRGWYIFFDEIQYLKQWEVNLKSLVDSYPGNTFVVSGSAAAALPVKSTESGAGRFTDFLLPPLTFFEYIALKKLEHLVRPAECAWNGNTGEFYAAFDANQLNEHFLDYINFGGYPELVFSDEIRANTARYIKNDIVDKVLLRDLPGIYGIRDVQELNAFFGVLAYWSGNEVSLESLSQSSGVDKNLLKKYIRYLEAAYLIKTVQRVDDSAKRFRRAAFYKIYLTNPALRSALFAPISATDDHTGAMVETALFAQWLHGARFTPYYARWSSGRVKGEVDLVGLAAKNLKPEWAVEMKWSNRYFANPAELKSLIAFCKKNTLSSALVTTIDKEGAIEHEGIRLFYTSAAAYAYTIGANTLKR